MLYQKQTDLIELKVKAGLTNRELAAALGLSPGAVGCKLTGFIALTSEERKIIEGVCNDAIKAHRESEK
jgi:cyanate lyase